MICFSNCWGNSSALFLHLCSNSEFLHRHCSGSFAQKLALHLKICKNTTKDATTLQMHTRNASKPSSIRAAHRRPFCSDSAAAALGNHLAPRCKAPKQNYLSLNLSADYYSPRWQRPQPLERKGVGRCRLQECGNRAVCWRRAGGSRFCRPLSARSIKHAGISVRDLFGWRWGCKKKL